MLNYYDQVTVQNYTTFIWVYLTYLLTVIAGLTRNLSSGRVSSPRLGDGGCFSAMTVIVLG